MYLDIGLWLVNLLSPFRLSENIFSLNSNHNCIYILCLDVYCALLNSLRTDWCRCLLVQWWAETGRRHTFSDQRAPSCVSQDQASVTTTVKTKLKTDTWKKILSWFLLTLNCLLLGEFNFPFIMAAIIAQLTRAKRERANKKTYEPNKVQRTAENNLK